MTTTSPDTYRTLSGQLSALAEFARSAGSGRNADPSRSPGSYSVSLLESLFMIDDDFSLADRGFLNDVLGSGKSLEGSGATARGSHGRPGRAFAMEIPPFVASLAALDRDRHTQYALRALQIIRAMIFTAATAENFFSGEEADFLTTHISVLGRHLMQTGVATETEVVGAGMKSALIEDLISKDRSVWPRPARYEADSLPDSASSTRSASDAPGEPAPSLAELMAQLTNLVGLEAVKRDVTTMSNQIRIRQVRAERGLPVPPTSNHLVFSGNPGTGKTTVARILSSIYRALGALKKGHLVETDRSGMVAGYVGQTGPRVTELVARARGGVLFIDEAYALTPARPEGDFGTEAVECLLKLMEDHRDDLVVIVAGYEARMAEFLGSNPGLASRFNKFIRFPDYSPSELTDIFRLMASSNQYELTEGAWARVTGILTAAHAARDDTFGNARLVRNLFEQSLALQANRLAGEANPSTADLCLLAEEDVPRDPVLY